MNDLEFDFVSRIRCTDGVLLEGDFRGKIGEKKKKSLNSLTCYL